MPRIRPTTTKNTEPISPQDDVLTSLAEELAVVKREPPTALLQNVVANLVIQNVLQKKYGSELDLEIYTYTEPEHRFDSRSLDELQTTYADWPDTQQRDATKNAYLASIKQLKQRTAIEVGFPVYEDLRISNMRKQILEIEQEYADLNFNYAVPSLADILEMLHREKIVFDESSELANFPLYSYLCLVRVGNEVQAHLFLRQNLSDFQKAFFLAHELGYWFLHTKRWKQRILEHEIVPQKIEFLALNDYSQFEHQATIFAMIFLLPTAELAYFFDTCSHMNKEEQETYCLDLLCKKYASETHPPSPKLQEAALKNIQLRLDNFTKFYRDHIRPSLTYLNRDWLSEAMYLFLSKEFFSDRAWAYTEVQEKDGQSVHFIKEVSPAFIKLLGKQHANDLIGKPLLDLIDPMSRTRMVSQLKTRSNKSGIYFTRYENQVMVSLVAWPVYRVDSKGMTYVGSFAHVNPSSVDADMLNDSREHLPSPAPATPAVELPNPIHDDHPTQEHDYNLAKFMDMRKQHAKRIHNNQKTQTDGEDIFLVFVGGSLEGRASSMEGAVSICRQLYGEKIPWPPVVYTLKQLLTPQTNDPRSRPSRFVFRGRSLTQSRIRSSPAQQGK